MLDDYEIEVFLDARGSSEGWSRHTRAAYRADLVLYRAHLEAIGKTSWAASNGAAVLSFLARRRKAGDAARTIARRRAALATFHRHLLEEKIIRPEALDNLPPAKREKSLPHFLTAAEVEALVRAAPATSVLGLRDRAIIELLYASGIRASELAGLLPGDLIRRGGVIAAVKVLGKRSKERYVPLHRTAADLLEAYMLKARPKLVKPVGATNLFLRKDGRGMTRLDLYQRLRKLGLAAGIRQRVTPHLLRHTFATHLVHEGADLRAVQELLGHADLSTTTIYTSVDTKRLKDTHARFHPRG